jgi:hypothetical protein
MIIDDLDIVSVAPDPAEAEAKLVVDADAVLTEPIAGQLFEPIRGRHFQVGEGRGGVEHDELAKCDAQEIRWESANFVALEQAFRIVVAKTANHVT